MTEILKKKPQNSKNYTKLKVEPNFISWAFNQLVYKPSTGFIENYGHLGKMIKFMEYCSQLWDKFSEVKPKILKKSQNSKIWK